MTTPSVPSSETIASILRRFSAFADLSDSYINLLAENSSPFHCSVGQELLVNDRLPEYVYCVVEGRGRVLHHDPALRRPVTLAYSHQVIFGLGWFGTKKPM